MKEIKYLSHLSRNFYLYFILLFTYRLLNLISPNPSLIVLGLFAFVVSYSQIYFLNDYTDIKEEKELSRANLYLLINNEVGFWLLTVFLILSGFLFTYYFFPSSFFILIVLYLLNFTYSFPPLRLRNKSSLREILIFVIYFFKWVLISSYWKLSFNYFPLPILFMASSLAALNVAMYKRHMKINKLSEYFFGFIFLIFWVITVYSYRRVFLLFFPLLPVAIFLWFKYRRSQIPIGHYQTLYFVYTVIIFLLFSRQ